MGFLWHRNTICRVEARWVTSKFPASPWAVRSVLPRCGKKERNHSALVRPLWTAVSVGTGITDNRSPTRTLSVLASSALRDYASKCWKKTRAACCSTLFTAPTYRLQELVVRQSKNLRILFSFAPIASADVSAPARSPCGVHPGGRSLASARLGLAVGPVSSTRAAVASAFACITSDTRSVGNLRACGVWCAPPGVCFSLRTTIRSVVRAGCTSSHRSAATDEARNPNTYVTNTVARTATAWCGARTCWSIVCGHTARAHADVRVRSASAPRTSMATAGVSS